jgi:hypothetical protein
MSCVVLLHVLQDGDAPVLLPYICKYRPCPTRTSEALHAAAEEDPDFVPDSLFDLLGNRHQYINHRQRGGGDSSAEDTHEQQRTGDSSTTDPQGGQSQHYINQYSNQRGDDGSPEGTTAGDQHYIRETVEEAVVADLEEQQEAATGLAGARRSLLQTTTACPAAFTATRTGEPYMLSCMQ